jgi:hypothetical protein
MRVIEIRLHRRNIPATPHGADFRHSVSLMQRGQIVKLTAAITAKHGFADRLLRGEEGQPVPGGEGRAGHQSIAASALRSTWPSWAARRRTLRLSSAVMLLRLSCAHCSSERRTSAATRSVILSDLGWSSISKPPFIRLRNSSAIAPIKGGSGARSGLKTNGADFVVDTSLKQKGPPVRAGLCRSRIRQERDQPAAAIRCGTAGGWSLGALARSGRTERP